MGSGVAEAPPTKSTLIFEADRAAYIPTTDLVSFILDNPRYDRNEPVYLNADDPSQCISYNGARKLICQFIAGLRAAGVQEGDCVLVHAFNHILYPIFFLSIVGVGGVFAGTNPAYTQAELRHHIQVAKASFLIAESSIAAPLLKAAADVGLPDSKVRIFNPLEAVDPTGCQPLDELLSHGEETWVRFDNLERCKTTTAARLFTSGTSGPPKAAIVSHYNLIAQHMIITELNPKPYQASEAPKEVKHSKADSAIHTQHISIIATPSFHAATVPGTHVSALRVGHRLYIMRRFELEKYLVYFEKYQCTGLNLVPPMAIAIIMSPFAKTRNFLKTARMGIVGAAILDKGSQSRLESMLSPGTHLIQGYGLTEVTGGATAFVYPAHDDTGSVGKLLPGFTAKLIDSEGNNITGYNIRGELCLKGPSVISGYFENPKATADLFDSEGFLKTGDIAYVAPGTNKFYIVDRIKELIKVRGFQVAPAEIESILLSHPQIIDAAVIGVPSSQGLNDEAPRAYIVRRAGPHGLKLVEKDIQTFCAERLASFKQLHGGIVFLDAIPKNPTGKVLKRVLREMAGKADSAKL